MQWTDALARFTFLAEAFDGTGGFAPRVEWQTEVLADGATRRLPLRADPCHLVPYARESAAKFAGRCALATYENHLRSACERFVGFLGRRRPQRIGADTPLNALLMADADRRGMSLEAFFYGFALGAKARGSMLLLIDLPPAAPDGQAMTRAEQIATRRVPYLRAIPPEALTDFEIDPTTGRFVWAEIAATERVGSNMDAVRRRWDAQGWAIMRGDEVLRQGAHPFGACPLLAFTESLQPFPHVGRYAQIADLSRDLFNAQSENRELLRSQTFGLLTLQVPADQQAGFDFDAATAKIGTHSMLVHPGITPAYVSPDAGPAQAYAAAIARAEAAIDRISLRESTADATSGQESGIARKLRFEALNAELAAFAHAMQQLEREVWALYGRAVGTANNVEATWPTDFNLADVASELDILSLMQSTSFPEAALVAKRRAIAALEFDNADDTTKAGVDAAINEQLQGAAAPD